MDRGNGTIGPTEKLVRKDVWRLRPAGQGARHVVGDRLQAVLEQLQRGGVQGVAPPHAFRIRHGFERDHHIAVAVQSGLASRRDDDRRVELLQDRARIGAAETERVRQCGRGGGHSTRRTGDDVQLDLLADLLSDLRYVASHQCVRASELDDGGADNDAIGVLCDFGGLLWSRDAEADSNRKVCDFARASDQFSCM